MPSSFNLARFFSSASNNFLIFLSICSAVLGYRNNVRTTTRENFSFVYTLLYSLLAVRRVGAGLKPNRLLAPKNKLGLTSFGSINLDTIRLPNIMYLTNMLDPARVLIMLHTRP